MSVQPWDKITIETLDPEIKLCIKTYAERRLFISYRSVTYNSFLDRAWVARYRMYTINEQSEDFYAEIGLLNETNNAKLRLLYDEGKYICKFMIGPVLIDTVEFSAVYEHLEQVVFALQKHIQTTEEWILSTKKR